MEKIVITDSDLENVAEQPAQQPSVTPEESSPITWWARILVILLVPFLPLLCLAAFFIRLAKRQKTLNESAAWSQFLGSALIVSGLIYSIGLLILAYLYKDELNLGEWGNARQQHAGTSDTTPSDGAVPIMRTTLFALDSLESFPELPTENFLPENAEEAMNSMVFLLTNQPEGLPWLRSNWAAMGTATLLWSSPEHGYLLATAAHVVEGSDMARIACREQPSQTIPAKVVGLNLDSDIALLWIAPSGKESNFLQPISPFDSVTIGSQAYTIGHPEGHLFSLSDGLISQKRGSSLLQTSAPVSPGNSGGPLYDKSGNLLAIISYVVDKEQEPNAENLNFGYKAELFLNASEGWSFLGKGAEIHEAFRQAYRAKWE